jgi:hypothetical protein
MTPEQIGTLKYIAESPPEAHGGFAAQTVEAAKWALAEIERLSTADCSHGYALHALKREIGMGLDEQSEDYSEIAVKVGELKAENERLKSAFVPTIELLERVQVCTVGRTIECHPEARHEITRLRAIVEKGTP